MTDIKITKHNGSIRNLLECTQSNKRSIVSALGCHVYSAAHEMENNRIRWKDDRKMCAFHVVQNFDSKTKPKKANKMGINWCKGLYPNFQCLVTTHFDKGHIHNHIVICATGLNGEKLKEISITNKEKK